MSSNFDFLKAVSECTDIPFRLKQILNSGSKFIINKVDNSVESYSHRDAIIDGELIFKVLVFQHGLHLDRFSSLNPVQRKYVISLISVILERMVEHLEKLSHFDSLNHG